MKKFLLAILFLSVAKIQSQSLILTQAAFEPIIGDTNRTWAIDTTAYGSGLNVASTGSSNVWNYASLNATSNGITSPYVNPSTIPSATAYAGCTVVQKQTALNTYYKSVSSPSPQVEFMGITSSSLTMNFTNTAVFARFPFAYNDVVTDNFAGNFSTTVPFTISGTASGNATITADGAGTLIIPTGTLNNVLRVKSYQNTNLNGGLVNGNIKQTTYSFYHASQKFPVLSINYQTISITGAGSPTVSGQVLGNKNNFVVGVGENSINSFNYAVYPNPVTDVLNLSIDQSTEPRSLKVINQIGQTVYAGDYSAKVDVSQLNTGIYIIEVSTLKGVARKKFMKE